MPSTFNLSSEPRVLACPNCGQTINTSMTECPFCHAAVDTGVAEAAADKMAKINQACSDASFLGVMVFIAYVFFFLRFVPLISWIGFLGFWFLLIATPIMTIRWFIKFGLIKTDDRDYRRARFRVMLSSGGIALVIALFIAAILFAMHG